MRHFFRLLLLLSLTFAPAAHAGVDERGHKLEAAFLYNFFNYITWPGYKAPEEMKQATICILEGDPVRPYLEYIQQKMAAERTLMIRVLAEDDGYEGCHLLYLRNAAAFSRAGNPTDMLTVASTKKFLGQGGMIELAQEDARIAIDINNTLLSQAGFQASSRLLSLARSVR